MPAKKTIQMRDINSDDIGFVDFSYDCNRQRIETFFKLHPLNRKETEAKVDRILRYPDSFLCP